MAESISSVELQRIRTEEVPLCLLCDTPGRPVYTGLSDRYFNVPGLWKLIGCRNCHLLWLNPRPLPADLGRLYAEYYTHSVSTRYSKGKFMREAIKHALWAAHCGYSAVLPQRKFWRRAGHWLGVVPSLKRKAEREILYLHGRSGGRLLDIGCGDGSFLRQMRNLGWEVYGIEPDPNAARVARREFGLDVRQGSISDVGFANEFFDAIVLSHVIEHVLDPIALLRQCRALLTRSGRLVAATPNGCSVGHRLQKGFWKELDPPRHLYVFTPETLTRSAEKAGLRVERVASSSRNAREIWVASRHIRRSGRISGTKSSRRLTLEGMVFSMTERILQALSKRPVGEEITLIASRVG